MRPPVKVDEARLIELLAEAKFAIETHGLLAPTSPTQLMLNERADTLTHALADVLGLMDRSGTQEGTHG